MSLYKLLTEKIHMLSMSRHVVKSLKRSRTYQSLPGCEMNYSDNIIEHLINMEPGSASSTEIEEQKNVLCFRTKMLNSGGIHFVRDT